MAPPSGCHPTISIPINTDCRLLTHFHLPITLVLASADRCLKAEDTGCHGRRITQSARVLHHGLHNVENCTIVPTQTKLHHQWSIYVCVAYESTSLFIWRRLNSAISTSAVQPPRLFNQSDIIAAIYSSLTYLFWCTDFKVQPLGLFGMLPVDKFVHACKSNSRSLLIILLDIYNLLYYMSVRLFYLFLSIPMIKSGYWCAMWTKIN